MPSRAAATSNHIRRASTATVWRPLLSLIGRRGIIPVGILVAFLFLASLSTKDISPAPHPVHTAGPPASASIKKGEEVINKLKAFLPANWQQPSNVRADVDQPAAPLQRNKADLKRPTRFQRKPKLKSPSAAAISTNDESLWDFTRRDGRLLVSSLEETTKSHPIPVLMARAKKKWAALQARQSTTFAQAVQEYERRNGRKPPKGFDRWYAFVRKHDVKMVDEFDLATDSLAPFYAFSPRSFRNRVEYVSKWPVTSHGWGLRKADRLSKLEMYGNARNNQRALDLVKLLSGFVDELDGFEAYFTAHDGPHIWVSSEERERLMDLVKRGECAR